MRDTGCERLVPGDGLDIEVEGAEAGEVPGVEGNGGEEEAVEIVELEGAVGEEGGEDVFVAESDQYVICSEDGGVGLLGWRIVCV